MNEKREIGYGKVVEYNGYNGKIISEDKQTYLLRNEDIVKSEEIDQGSYVNFEKEVVHNLEIGDIYVARFVKKLKKNN